MKPWLKRIQAWRTRRDLRWLEHWEQTRARGKKWFVFRTALTYGLVLVGAFDVFENLFYGRHYLSLGHLTYYLLTGILVAVVGWSSMEGKYHKALAEARAKALPGSNPTTNDHA